MSQLHSSPPSRPGGSDDNPLSCAGLRWPASERMAEPGHLPYRACTDCRGSRRTVTVKTGVAEPFMVAAMKASREAYVTGSPAVYSVFVHPSVVFLAILQLGVMRVAGAVYCAT